MDSSKEVAFEAVNGIAAARNSSDRVMSLILAVAIKAVEIDRAARRAREAAVAFAEAAGLPVDTVDSMLEYLQDGFGAAARNDGLFEPDEIAEAVEALLAIKKEVGE